MDEKYQHRINLIVGNDNTGTNPNDSNVSKSTLRRPMHIIKKRSGPLEDALADLNSNEQPNTLTSQKSSQNFQPATTKTITPSQCVVVQSSTANIQLPTASSRRKTSNAPTLLPNTHRKSYIKEKNRERWLLTRKTWKYMTDAGRKLIPEGVHNGIEDVPTIERHYHQVCASEPRFILWRRKSSYPGAIRNSKRRLKQLLSHTGQKIQQSLDSIQQEEANNADHIIDLLQSYLKLDEARKTTTLLGSKTVRPDQTESPSARRPSGSSSSANRQSFASPQNSKGLQSLSEMDQLLERLRALSHTSYTFHSITDRITPEILENKVLLKQIYNELKKQQLHRILGRHSMPLRPHLSHSTSVSNLWQYGNSKQKLFSTDLTSAAALPASGKTKMSAVTSVFPSLASNSSGIMTRSNSWQRQCKPPSTLNLLGFHSSSYSSSQQVPVISIKKPSIEKTFNSCGTQTSFIQLNEIKYLAEEYKERKREEAMALLTAATDGDNDKNSVAVVPQQQSESHHRQKSSIENEDVSQSVSDTIKRYLRMARKKSVHDENASRFKRVNYDRILQMKRAREIVNPPGMDEENNKAVQTLDAWAVITLDFIRGNENCGILDEAHAEWDKSAEERLKKQVEYEKNAKQEIDSDSGTVTRTTINKSKKKSTHSSCSSSSAPTSPTMTPESSHTGGGTSSLLHSSTQFLSNLWHGSAGSHSQQLNPSSSASNSLTNSSTSALTYNQKHSRGIEMQKSKSSSNVGQFVSKKLLKSRSKSQTRPTSPILPKWTPAEKLTWTSDSGGRIMLTDVTLLELSDIEAKILQRVAIEKIIELNIGMNITVPCVPLCKSSVKVRSSSKKKAIPTSFFDIGKKDDKNKKDGNFSVFGSSLENCVANDKKRRYNSELASYDHGSRNSIASLFRSSSSKVRSCESLPSTIIPSASQVSEPSAGSGESRTSNAANRSSDGNIQADNCNLVASQGISRSQYDMRRTSQDYDTELLQLSSLPSISVDNARQVPTFINACIRHIEENGLHLVGIFRVSTSKKRVRQLRDEFDRNALTTTSIDVNTCPHDVATLLKEFLRDLPEPLLCKSLYKPFLETQRIRNRRLQLEAIAHLVKLLPIAHRDTLYVLLKFLANVASCSDDVCNSDGSVQISGNKMDSNNLAIVFAPNILRGALTNAEGQTSSVQSDASSEQESMADAINVIRTMIDHFEALFRVPAELIDTVYTHMFDACPQQLNYLCEQRCIYDTDEMESASPPLSTRTTCLSDVAGDLVACKSRQRTDSNDFADDIKSTNNTLMLSTNTKTGMVTSPSAPVRKVYTRASVMHENSASKGGVHNVNGSTSSNSSRSRRSKSKYPESVNRTIGSGYAAENSLSKMIDQQQLQRDEQQSDPYTFKKTGVVTASLKIPIQLQASSQSTAVSPCYDDSDDVFHSTQYTKNSANQQNLADIPYIEDVLCSSQQVENLREGFPITGYLSFGGATGKYNEAIIPTALKGRTIADTPVAETTSPLPKLTTFSSQQEQQQLQKQKKLLTTMRMKSMTSVPYTATIEAANANKNGENINQHDISAIEPKLTTSISNIGGAILRSKTADFERMTSTSNSNKQSERRLSQTPLYKRQAIISSAKNSTTKK